MKFGALPLDYVIFVLVTGRQPANLLRVAGDLTGFDAIVAETTISSSWLIRQRQRDDDRCSAFRRRYDLDASLLCFEQALHG